VDGRRCGAFDRNLKKKNSYLFIFTFGSRSITNSTLFICLLYEYSKRFVQPVVRSVVQPAAKCKRPLAGALRGRRLGLWAYYNCDTSTIRVRFDYDLTTIRARYNILRGVMCFRAIMNTSILSRCCRML